MSLSLTPETERAIEKQVNSGRYQSADDVILEALILIEERDRTSNEQQLKELRQKIAIGTEHIANGNIVDGENALENLRSKIQTEYFS